MIVSAAYAFLNLKCSTWAQSRLKIANDLWKAMKKIRSTTANRRRDCWAGKKRRKKADDQEREYFKRREREREIRDGQSTKQEVRRAKERKDNNRWTCNYLLNSIFPLIGFSAAAYIFAYFGIQWALIWAVFFMAIYIILRRSLAKPKQEIRP